MRSPIYCRLAAVNLKNNRKTYLPYILTGMLTAAMFYIMDALALNSSFREEVLRSVLQYAVGVIAVFSIIFLFYTNSFLIKRRKKEIGVYNILGMGKPHISRMLAVETAVTSVISIVGGIAAGALFCRLMFLVLLKILREEVDLAYEIPMEAARDTLVLFFCIFLLTLCYNLMQIRLSDPIGLLRGSSQGEREPKTKWLIALIGFLLLGTGYGLSLATESPMEAISTFFIAVICVILGTYALFIAGSIAILKLMRSHKKYYYQSGHFVAVSGMIYRMKQNAAGLANICILSTMVLVMISSTASLYMGIDDIMKYRCPTDMEISMDCTEEYPEKELQACVEEELQLHHVEMDPDSFVSYHIGGLAGNLKGESLSLEVRGDYSLKNAREVLLMPLADYNQMEGKNVTLHPDEVIVYTTNEMYGHDRILLNGKEYQVKEEARNLKIEKKNKTRVLDAFYIIMDQESQIREMMNGIYEACESQDDWLQSLNTITYHMNFDLEGEGAQTKSIQASVSEGIMNKVPQAYCETKMEKWESAYELYGGLLFLGGYLGVMFLMATVLIIYYKQISEGYDDQERYRIMQKVGMDQREVKRSIKSQVVTVFILPLAMSVLHIAVAFQVIRKLLVTMGFVNTSLFLMCTVGTILVFALFYGIVYVVTAKEYYRIVKW